MKTTYTLFISFLLFGYISRAQLTLTKAANEPIVGDVNHAVSYDTVTALPKNTGVNQSWNFSNLSKNSYTETTTYISTSAATGASLFPGATIAANRGGSSFEFFKATANTWEFVGDYQTLGGDYVYLSNSGVFNNWPISISSTFSDVAVGFQSSGTNTTAINGILSYTASGSGTVTLPGSIVYNNCLQLIQKLTITIGTGTNIALIEQTTYYYYTSGKKFPIAEFQYEKETTSNGVNESFSGFLEFNVPVGLQEQYHHTFTFQVSPNPAQNKLRLEIPGDVMDFNLKVIDMKGDVVFNAKNTTEIDVSQWSEGLYTICLNTSQQEQRKRIAVVR